MSKRILLGVDTPMSPATLHALRTLSELIEQVTHLPSLILLHVIPAPSIASPSLGVYTGQMASISITSEQQAFAEHVLQCARTELEKQGFAPEHIETLVHMGTGIPADGMVKVAKELQVDLIVIGCHGNSIRQRLRRLFTGSTSRRVLHLAPCPVMIVTLPQLKQPVDLVRWYEESITRYLNEHTGDLAVFTPGEVAAIFAPPNKKTPGRKETAAAILALEQLARNGVLCRHDVKGEARYVND